MNKLDYSRMKDAPAIQFMVLDMLGNIMTLAETPSRMGVSLTQQIRQLVGAKIVALIHYTGWERSGDFRFLAVEPERQRESLRLEGLGGLVPILRTLEKGVLWSRDDHPAFASEAFLAMGCESLIAIPLTMGAEPVGALLALDLLAMERHEDVLRSLEILGPFVGIVIRNAFYYENLEAEVEERTRELAESERRFRNLAEAAPVGIYHLDGEGRLVFVNEQWRQITGLTWLEGPPEAFHDLIHPEDRPRIVGLWQEAMAGRRDFQGDYRLLRADGSIVWVIGTAVFEFDETGRFMGVIGTLLNITLRRQAEAERNKFQAQLLQVQKMESLGNLAGGVAHDMNNVLGAVLAMASANLEIQEPGSPAYRAFETIVQAATRGGKMVKGLLNFARQSTLENQVLDMNAILQEEVNLLERTTLAKVHLVLDLAHPLGAIRGDASALTHAVMNLCVNAVDAMPENGTLTLSTRNVDGQAIEVLVQDTGSGMTKDVLDKALDPFFTTKEQGKGTGLGLSMVYATVKAHQGTLDIQSEPGRGTRIRLRFPACPGAMETGAEVDPRVKKGSARRLSILVVDDDPLIQSSFRAQLDVLGHEVVTTPCGEDALGVLRSGLQPDLVILDMNMPGLGGRGTLPLLRVQCPTVPVLIVTGRGDQGALDLVQSHAHVSVLLKPFTLKDLQDQLRHLSGDEP